MLLLILYACLRLLIDVALAPLRDRAAEFGARPGDPGGRSSSVHLPWLDGEPGGNNARMETALVIAAEALPAEISTLRRHLDPSAAAGVPDHITILYPFVPGDQLDEGIFGRLGDVIAQVHAFDYRLVAVSWFGTAVMWLAPNPDEPFRHLTRLVEAAFGIPPYEGAYDDVTPHLTLADHADLDAMRSAADLAARHLPIIERAEAVRLLRKIGLQWYEVQRFELGR